MKPIFSFLFVYLLLFLFPLTYADTFSFTANPTVEVANTVWRYSDVDAGNTLDMILEVTGRGSDNSPPDPTLDPVDFHAPSSSARIVLNDNPSDNPWLTFTLKFVTADAAYTSSAHTITNLRIQGFDIDSDNGEQFTDMFGYRDTLSPTVELSANTNLEQAGWLNGGVSGYTMYRAQDLGSDGWAGNTNIDNTDFTTQTDYTVNFVFDTFTVGEFAVGITGAQTVLQDRGFFLNMTNPPYIVVPEPGSLVLAGIFCGTLLGAGILRRRGR
jgi:hypothetical protein